MKKRNTVSLICTQRCIIIITLMCMLFIATGCSSTSTKYNFQQDIRLHSHHEKQNAKECIQSKGYSLKEKAKVLRVESVAGQRKFNEGWAWKEPVLGDIWVLGLCWNKGNGQYLVQVGANPNNSKDISLPILRHEMGHFWLMSNHNIHHHDSTFSSCFINWRDVGVRAMSIEFEDGAIVIIDYVVEDEN